jgi:hypothetical protein
MIVWAIGSERLSVKRMHSFGQEAITAAVSWVTGRLSLGRTSSQRGQALLGKRQESAE